MSDTPQSPIPYERDSAGGGMTRRQGRWLIFLMLVNTVLLALGVAGPQVGPMVRKEIEDWRARRAAAKAEEQKAAARAQARQRTLAMQSQWLNFNFAPGTIVYEEDPKVAAAHLISGKGWRAIETRNMPNLSTPWQPPVVAPVPTPVNQAAGSVYGSDEGILFLHERRTPAGAPKLVCVSFRATQTSVDVEGRTLDQRIVTDVKLYARAMDPVRPESDDTSPDLWKTQELTLVLPPEAGTGIRFTGSSRPGPHVIYPGAYLKLLAGAPDPKDPTHFTIPYQLGKTSGTIDGWLRDDAIELRGREGEMGPQSSWLLPAPATRPSKP